MYAPAIAEQLRRRGHDVIAAVAQLEMADLLDPDLFASAQGQGRVIVTENIDDFLVLDAQYREQGQEHMGLILTNNHRFPRGVPATTGQLVRALDAWLQEHPGDEPAISMIWWL
jgi:hypothetical protein